MKITEENINNYKLPELRHPLTKLTIINSNGIIESYGGRQYNCKSCGCPLEDDGIYHIYCKKCRKS